MQLTAVGKEIWRAAGKAQQLEEAGAGDATVKERLQKLRLAEALRKREVDWSEIKELVGISRATYYRWQRRLQEEEGGGRRAKGFGPQTQTTQTPTAEGLLDARTTHRNRSLKETAPHLGQVAHLADSEEATGKAVWEAMPSGS